MNPDVHRSRLRWLLLILAVAAADYASGRLGMLLAIPPGFVTAVWPPSGIALAALLLFGYRVWPGVWLGSFAINIFIAAQAGPITDWPRAALVAGTIGLGSSAQAALGAWLIRREIGFPNALMSLREIALFILLGGPVSCLVAATVGVSALVSAGLVPGVALPFQWFNWWVGDIIGVLIVTPLLLIALAEPRAVWRSRAWPVGLPLLFMFALTVLAFVFASYAEQTRINVQLQRQMSQLTTEIRASIERKLDTLHATAGLFDQSTPVTRAGFQAFAKRVSGRVTGVQALAWCPRVPRAQRATYERAARDDGFDGFQFTERDGDAFRPAGERDEYFPAFYVEPRAGNETAFGYDIGSEAKRMKMLAEARYSTLPAASAPITLVLDRGNQRGVLIALALYRGGARPDRAAERSENLSGYVLLALRIRDLVADAVHSFEGDDFILSLEDAAEPESQRELLAPESVASLTSREQGLTQPAPLSTTEEIRFVGRRWLLRVTPTLAAAARHRTLLPWSVLAGGLLFTGLFGTFLLATSGRAEPERDPENRTRDTDAAT